MCNYYGRQRCGFKPSQYVDKRCAHTHTLSSLENDAVVGSGRSRLPKCFAGRKEALWACGRWSWWEGLGLQESESKTLTSPNSAMLLAIVTPHHHHPLPKPPKQPTGMLCFSFAIRCQTYHSIAATLFILNWLIWIPDIKKDTFICE